MFLRITGYFLSAYLPSVEGGLWPRVIKRMLELCEDLPLVQYVKLGK